MATSEKKDGAFTQQFSPGPTLAGVATSCLYLAAKPIVGGPDWCACGHGDNGWISECPENCPDKKTKEI